MPQRTNLMLGQFVSVNDKSDFASDFKDGQWQVVALALEVTGRISVTIAQMGNYRWDSMAEGFRPEELTPEDF